MELRRKLTLIGFLLLKLSLPILIIFIILISCKASLIFFIKSLDSNPNSIYHPLISDDELTIIFNENRQQFALLGQMLSSEDEIVSIYPSTNQCKTIDEDRIDAADNLACQNYITTFNNLGILDANTKLLAGGEDVRLTVENYGLVPGSQSKGYYYAPGGLPAFGILSDNTDYTDGQFIYQYLEGDWYIFHYK